MVLIRIHRLILCILFEIAYSCTSNTALYKKVGNAVTLQFQARTTDLQHPATGTVSNLILQPSGDTILTVLYKNGNHVATGKCSGCTFTGNTAGDISIRLDNLQKSAGGIYKHALTSGDNVLECVTVYILGVPTKPAITGDKNPSVRESVTLACSSTSTTTPSHHGLSLIYTWRVDNVDNPSDSRYTYSANKRTLTVSNVVREDASKQFTCTVRENVNEGYTSVSSDSFSPNVLYGPENMAFNPTNTAYVKEENSTLNDVTCTAVCNPPCTFTWTKIGQGSVISNTADLSLDSLESSEAGTYTCTATRSGGSPRTKDLTVNVIYGPRSMSFTPATTAYREDENVDIPRITCNSECWDCQYSWTGPNSYSSSTSDFDLRDLTKSMDGNYRCTATNIKSQQQTQESKDLKIEVRYGPDSVSLTPATTNYIIDEGSTLGNIKCYSDCFPTCRYTWTKEGQSSAVSDTDTLPLGTVQKGFTGKYTCRAINSDKSSKRMEKSVTITVRYGPDKLSPTAQTYTHNEGKDLPDITCSSDCYPDCTYTWTKVRQGSSSVVKNDGILSLGSLTRDKAANYTCTAKNPGKLNSTTRTVQVEVIVRYGPDPLNCSVQSPFTVTEGEIVQDITCSSDCYPGCSYSWKNDTANRRSSSNGVLSLRTVNRYMAGSYTLTASNTATQYEQTAKKIITVIVNYAPDLSTRLSSTDITEGASLTLFCDGFGFPSTNYYVSLTQNWNNVLIPNNNTELPGTETKSSVHFNQLKLQDTGRYTCTLNNGIKNINGILNQVISSNISVKVSPKVLIDELRFTGATNRMAQIQVPVYSFPDLETATFTRYDDKTITTDNKYNITIQPDAVRTMFYGTSVTLTGNMVELTIRNLEENDFGNYTLKLTNRLNMTTVKVYLIAEGRPSPPKVFEYISENSIPTFLWQKNFSGGPEQSFVIQTSVAGAEEWTNHTNINEHDLQYKINDTFYMTNITGLSPGTYSARIFANNTEGDSELVYLGHTFIISEEDKEPPSHIPIAAVAGGSVSALVLIGLVAGILFVLRRRAGKKDGSRTKLNTRNHHVDEEDDDEDEVNTVNPMYVSADEVPPVDNTYSQPIKKKKDANVNQLYAMVDKKTKKGEKAKEANKKSKDNIDGDIYENAPDISSKGKAKMKPVTDRKGKAPEENVYENPETDKAKKPKKLVNKDGLIYADLTFNDQPKGQKKLVIHGLDDMTEYVEVDFTKKADPLPDSDEEDNNKKT